MIGIKLDMVNGGNPTLVQQGTALLRSQKSVYWRDPSDLSTLFQDSAGTTPVTAVEQPVGLVLDKSKGLVLGPELVTNGDNEISLFSIQAGIVSSDTVSRVSAPGGGFAAASTSTTSSSVAHRLYSITPMLAGKTYQLTGRFYVPTGGIGTFKIYDNIDGSWFGVSSTTKDQWVPFSVVRQAKATNWDLGIGDNIANTVTSGQVAFWLDDLSVREIPGNHFVQATPASRPTLSSRYNLLTKTEDFDDAYWLKQQNAGGSVPVVTPNAAVAPNGTSTADLVVFSTAAGGADYSILTSSAIGSISAGSSYVGSIRIKAATVGDVGKKITFWHAAAGGSVRQITLTDSWQTFSSTEVALNPTTNLRFGLYPVTGGSSGAVSVHVWGASLVPAADASLPYQRVNTATDYDYDFTKFPAYLRYDGVDDSQASAATVDLTGTDKITVVGAWHKASDAAQGILVETSSAVSSNNGAFLIAAPTAAGLAGYDLTSKGTTAVQAYSGSSFPAPHTAVLSAIGDISGDRATLRVNGVQRVQATGDQGTGNFGNYTTYVGSSAGSYLRFNGREYGHALFNTTLTASELAAVEAYFRAKSRAY